MFLRLRPILRLWFLGVGLILWMLSSTVSADGHFELDQLKQEILKNRNRVFEFEKIRKLAESKSLRVFLMGGIASSFAHYVSLDLERKIAPQAGLTEERFRYLWPQLIFPTQDIDLAITRSDETSETAEEIEEFKSLVESEFPNTKVDIFGLNTSFTNRPALRNRDSDFQNQNTDTISNGLIELTNQDLIEDLRSPDLGFLRSLIEKQIGLLAHPQHSETSRAMNGENPEFHSVIRLIMNASRYGLSIDEESQRMAQKIIDDFSTTMGSTYVKNWISVNAKKIVEQSLDLEKTFEILKSFPKFTEKLEKMDQNKKSKGSLSWLITRKPLESKPKDFKKWVVNPLTKRKTARELGISNITHGTSDYQIYRQIISNPSGRPNVFKSIEDTGQNAKYGEGFYTLKGDQGIGTYHIPLLLDPDAIEGEDFDAIHRDGYDMVLIYNRAKVQINPNIWSQFGWTNNLETIFRVFEEVAKDPSKEHLLRSFILSSPDEFSDTEREKVLQQAYQLLEKDGLPKMILFLMIFKWDSKFYNFILKILSHNSKITDRFLNRYLLRRVFKELIKFTANIIPAIGLPVTLFALHLIGNQELNSEQIGSIPALVLKFTNMMLFAQSFLHRRLGTSIIGLAYEKILSAIGVHYFIKNSTLAYSKAKQYSDALSEIRSMIAHSKRETRKAKTLSPIELDIFSRCQIILNQLDSQLKK